MTKLLQWTPSLEQEFQKKDDFLKGTIPSGMAQLQMLNDPNNETNWGIQPIVIKSPVLAKRVNCFRAWLEKTRVKSW